MNSATNQSGPSFNLLTGIYSCIIFNSLLLWLAWEEEIEFHLISGAEGSGICILVSKQQQEYKQKFQREFLFCGCVANWGSLSKSIFTRFRLRANKDKSVCLVCRTVVKGV